MTEMAKGNEESVDTHPPIHNSGATTCFHNWETSLAY